jgi:YjbE family integral membrane protein
MVFLYSVLRIIVIDLVLSGDNAVVIGMAAHRLPPQQRKMAILFGGAAAIVLRITLTAIAALLLRISGLQLVGGALLIWIAFKLLKEEEESKEGIKVAASMREAVITILVADFIMSLDNVLGVAGASNGDLTLLLFGLIFSMVILMFMGNLVANLINKFWWLSYVGAAVIAWTGALMVFEDPFVIKRAEWLSRPIAYTSAAVITIGVTVFAHWFHRMRGAGED